MSRNIFQIRRREKTTVASVAAVIVQIERKTHKVGRPHGGLTLQVQAELLRRDQLISRVFHKKGHKVLFQITSPKKNRWLVLQKHQGVGRVRWGVGGDATWDQK